MSAVPPSYYGKMESSGQNASPSPPPFDFDVKKDINVLGESELVDEIARVQEILADAELCGDAPTPYVAAVPVFNLPSHASHSAQMQKSMLIRFGTDSIPISFVPVFI
jgi:hypothetical protein